MMRIPLEQRFWSKVDKDGPTMPHMDTPCWVWTAGKFSDGYGVFVKDNKKKLAHRASYELYFGSIPEGMGVLHKCDNRPCIRPGHLFLGTQNDNIKDMDQKGRRRPLVGDEHWTHQKPELVKRGKDHWMRHKPERIARGERNGAHTHPERVLRGERSGNSKLTAVQVLNIREKYSAGNISLPELANEFEVTKQLIWCIVKRRIWKHI